MYPYANPFMLESVEKSNLDGHDFKEKIIAALREEENV